MLGWLRLAAAWASRLNRIRKLGSRTNWAWRTLMATRRASSRSRPSKTSAMPPAPSSRPTSYRSSRTCGVVDISRRPLGRWSGRSGDPGARRAAARLAGAAPSRAIGGSSATPEVGLHDPPGDGGGDVAAGGLAAQAAAVLDHHRDRDRPIAGAGEADEPGVRGPALGVLGGAGLAGHLEPGDLGGVAGAALDHLEHHVLEVAGHPPGDRLAEVL